MTTQNSAPRPPRALIAMSGGVDSSVAAWLMQRDGYDCTGITMRLTHNEMLGQSGFHTCCSEKDIEDAAEVAFALDIPYARPISSVWTLSLVVSKSKTESPLHSSLPKA